MIKTVLTLPAFLLVLAACNAPDVHHEADKHGHDHSGEFQTVKPGANLSMSFELRSSVAAGETGTLDLRFREVYDRGRLTLVASSDSDGLDIYGPTSETTRDLSVPGPKDWNVLFTADKEGIHYINVLATVEIPGEPVVSRAFSARVEVGDTAAAIAARELDVDVVTQSDGRRVKILPAEEPQDN